ncbi:uncharacterized protein BDZ99DRAFT_459852, partial [Mytilinidion resinicola]
MHALSLALLLSIIISTAAFSITWIENSECEGKTAPLGELKLTDGCQKVGGGNSTGMEGLNIGWTTAEDNDLVVAFFGDENCCNGINIGSSGWTPDCTSSVMKSYRVMDPNDINKGKDGENYDCVGN